MGEQDEPQTGAPPGGLQRLTPVDVQQKQFRLAFRGYNERDVDEFLDQVTEELARLHAESRRWQEELEMRRTMPLATGGAAEAEQMLARARQEAGRILAEAEAEARSTVAEARRVSEDVGAFSGQETGVGPADVRTGDFLGREKDFLQRLAGIIQEHAEAVKRDLRHIREAAPTGPSVQPATIETGPERLEAPMSRMTPSAPLVPEQTEPVAESFAGEAESEPAATDLPEREAGQTPWTPSKAEVEVVQAADRLSEPAPPQWEGPAEREPAPIPEPAPEPVEPTSQPSEPGLQEPAPESWEPPAPQPAVQPWEVPDLSEPGEQLPSPPVSESVDEGPVSAWPGGQEEDEVGVPSAGLEPEVEGEESAAPWTAPEVASTLTGGDEPGPSGVGTEEEGFEPEVAPAGEGFEPEVAPAGEGFEPEVAPEPAPAPSWGPDTEATEWGESPQEAQEPDEFLFEQPTLTGEPGPPPTEEVPGPENEGPQASDLGPTAEENDDEGEDRSLRELFWGED